MSAAPGARLSDGVRHCSNALLAALLLGSLGAPPAAARAVDVSSAPAIAEIRVQRTNVFDPAVPGENWWLFRLADKIHFVTREKVVRDELLFAPGDRWDDLTAIQTERNLRGKYSFRRAEVLYVPRPDGRVDAVVKTQDSWTLDPRMGIGVTGSQNSASFGIEEGNLLGYGKSVAYMHSEANTTSGYQHSDSISYGDPRFFGTRLSLGTQYTHSQDGDSESVNLSHPFYSLDTERAMTANFSNGSSVGTEVQNGQDFSNYFQRRRVVNAEFGRRLENDRYFVQRAEVGWFEDKAAYGATTVSPGTLPGTQPLDRHLSGPTVGYSWIHPDYIRPTYIDRMERIEDFNLGNELRARTGYMGRDFGSDRDRWVFYASDQQGVSLAPGSFALASVVVSGRIRESRWENGLATAGVNVFWKNDFWARHRTLVAHFETSQGRRLDKENQIVLGGSTGLRGYKADSFVGGRSILANLEDRVFLDGEYLHLARFGGVLFAESGAVVPEGSGFSPARFHSDVGFGLRGAATRSTSGGVVRLDLAYALNGGPGGSRWIVSLHAGQAFSLFNSAAQRVNVGPTPGL